MSLLPVAIIRKSSDGATQSLLGHDRTDHILAIRADMVAGKPGARRSGDRIVILAPLQNGTEYLFELSKIPPVDLLADAIRELQGLAVALEKRGAAQAVPTPGSDAAASVLRDFANSMNSSPAHTTKARITAAMDAVIHHGLGGSVTLAERKGNGRWRLSHHNRAHATLNREIQNLLTAVEQSDDTAVHARADGTDLQVDADLLRQRLGHSDNLVIALPENTDGQLAVVVGDPQHVDPTALPALLQGFIGGMTAPRTTSGWLRRAIGPVLLVGVLCAALVPVPIKLPATGQAVARHAQIVALPSEAFLDEIAVSPGEFVEQGQLLARFSAPQVEERIAELEMTITVEGVNAQDALAQNNFAGFQAAEQRQAIARTEIDALTRRLQALEPVAPVAGRVINAVSPGSTGQFFPLGEQIVKIQPEQSFDVTLTPSPLDAASIKPGLEGTIQFRGLADHRYRIRAISPPVYGIVSADGKRGLTYRARVLDADQSQLLTGLAGYARIETGRAPAGLVWGRYVLEWVRLKAWTLFALQI